jgi:geranylgeranyl diphosphate synthase type II
VAPFDLEIYLREKKAIVDSYLEAYMPPPDRFPKELYSAMRHTLFAGGKRIRPILHFASAEAVGGDISPLIPFACAIELIHTYSLIHDDLPAMDNDDYRRGLPSSHRVFGEAVAILAGDALLTEAFSIMSSKNSTEGLDPVLVLKIINEISVAIGASGMVGGQTVDILTQGKEVEGHVLEYIHTNKTGALIRASVRTGAILAGASKDELDALTRYGEAMGLSFQIRDDILNVEGSAKVMGKGVGTDMARKKVTYPSIFGIDESKKIMVLLLQEAIDGIAFFDSKADPLREIARYIISRTK